MASEVAQGSELRTNVDSVFNILSERQVFTTSVTCTALRFPEWNARHAIAGDSHGEKNPREGGG